ncbi:MAG: DUF3368 domain-containing protein [Nitrospirae bacterium]|nr:DUF3368 domain-containing protein [Nitrospirota bacterium]
MPDIILDACVLSNFALSHSLHILRSCYKDHAYVSSFVTVENLKGILSGYRELGEIRKALADEWLIEVSLDDTKEKAFFENLSVSLGAGEASSIAIAKVRGFVFASDDRVARREAELLGVPVTGTVGILYKAAKMKLITLRKADNILNRMIEKGIYSPVKSLRELTEY